MSASTLPKCCRCGAETPAWELTKAGDVCLMCVVIERDELGRLAEAAERAIEKANDARRAAWDRLDRVRAALNGADVVDGPDMGLEDRVDVLVGELEYLRPLRSKNEPEAPKPDAGSHAEVRRALETMLTTYDLMLANSQPAVRMLVEGWFAESLPHVRATLEASAPEASR